MDHNLAAFEHIHVDFSMPRMKRLISAATAIESVNSRSRILVIGPRTESDLMILKGLGFMVVEGVDLITYSP